MAERPMQFVERSDDEFLILGFDVNGRVRSDGVEAYLPQDASLDQVLVPLGAIAEALSFKIDVNPGDGVATGFYRDESNMFQLDLVNKQITLNSGTTPLPDNGAESHIDDIYVQATLLEEWFGVNINLNFNALVLEVSSKDLLPFEKRAERLRSAKTKLTDFSYGGLDTKNAYLLPYRFLSFPSFVIQNNMGASKSPNTSYHQNSVSLQANFDFLKFATDLNLSHYYHSDNGSQIQNSRLTFRRQDPKKELLGPLKTGKIEIGDIGFPSIPLFGGVGSGAGILFSSDPQLGTQFVRNEDDFVLTGSAPMNWDAELYRNGQFVDFKTIDDNGLYNFQNVKLIDGYNLFKIVLYGPEGQKEIITREIYRGPNLLRKNEIVYDAAIGSANTEFLPLKEDATKSTDLVASANVYYGITDFLTIGANVFDGRSNDQEERDRATAFSLASAFLGMNTQFELLSATEDRRAYRAQFRMRPKGYNVSGSFAEYKNYDVNDQDIKRVSSLSLSKSYGLISIGLTGKTTRFLDQEDEREIQTSLSTDLWGIKLTNQLDRVFSKNKNLERFDGELSLVTSLYDVRLRGNINYDFAPDAERKLETMRMSAQKYFKDESSLLLNTNYSFSSRIWTMDSRYTRQFGAVSVDLNMGASTDDNYTAGLTFRTGLQPDDEMLYTVVDAQTSSQASMGIRAYVDNNNNDRFDLGEELLPNVAFTSSRGAARSQTNENGIAWMHGMVESPTRIHVKHEELDTIYLMPKQEAYDVIPRKGANITLDYAFVRMGEIDGYVTTSGTGEDISNVPVRIISKSTGKETASMNTEYDGYFVFPSLPMGDYKIVASYDWLNEAKGQIIDKDFTLSSDNLFIYDMNLELDPYLEEDF